MLPMLLYVKMKKGDKRGSWVIPLTLIYLLLLPLVIVVAVVLLLLLVLPPTAELICSYLPALKIIPTLLSSSRGTEIVVKSDEEELEIRIS